MPKRNTNNKLRKISKSRDDKSELPHYSKASIALIKNRLFCEK
jgi:hypothetical protein